MANIDHPSLSVWHMVMRDENSLSYLFSKQTELCPSDEAAEEVVITSYFDEFVLQW